MEIWQGLLLIRLTSFSLGGMAGIYPHKTTTNTLPAEIDYIRRSRQSERLMAEMAASGEGGRTASWDFLVRSSREHVSDLQCTSTPKC